MHKKIPKIYRAVYEQKSVSKRPVCYRNYKICIFLSGNGVWQINGRQVSIGEGDVFLLCGNDYRCFTYIEEAIGMVICEFEPNQIERMYLPLFQSRPTELPRSFQLRSAPQFEKFIMQALQEAEGNKDYAAFCVEQNVRLALTDLLRRFGKGLKPPKVMRPEVKKTLAFVEEHITEEFSLEQLAKQCSLSPSALSKQFQKGVGTGFSRYVTQKRVEMAVDMLRSSDDNVLDIAYACGFRNSAAFYEAFRKITGTTPKDVRKNSFVSL